MNLPRTLEVSSYLTQQPRWPKEGRHIMAQYDSETICVYQAYQPLIADYASKHQQFGSGFSYNRMSWIKPNFLWMMYRSGWAAKPGQEKVLAIRIRRTFFEEILAEAIPSSFDPNLFETKDAWQQAVENSSVRLQWDPDHCPHGKPLDRRAVQLGLRGEMLARFGREQIVSIEDISPFVISQRPLNGDTLENLLTPVEEIYLPQSLFAANAVGISTSIHFSL